MDRHFINYKDETFYQMKECSLKEGEKQYQSSDGYIVLVFLFIYDIFLPSITHTN